MGPEPQGLNRKKAARNPKLVKTGGYIAAAGGVVAVGVAVLGGDARGTAGTVLFGVVLAGMAAVIGGVLLAAVAGRVPPSTPQEAKKRRSSAMIAGGVLALVLGLVGLVNLALVGILFAVLGAGLLVGGLVIRS